MIRMNRVILLFSLTLFSSIVILAEMTVPAIREFFRGSILFLLPFAIFFLLSSLLLFYTIIGDTSGWLRVFLLITGGAGAGVFISILLHNLIYGIFMHFFGEGIWNGVGGDEPVFFFFGLIVCPILYLIGALGASITFFVQTRGH